MEESNTQRMRDSQPKSQANSWTIDCVLPDGRPTFPVKIAKTETVGELKGAIKVKIPLSRNTIEARDLTLYKTLYKIDLDCSGEKAYTKQAKYLAGDPDDLLKLKPPIKLTTAFGPSGPLEEKNHILVIPPPLQVSQ